MAINIYDIVLDKVKIGHRLHVNMVKLIVNLVLQRTEYSNKCHNDTSIIIIATALRPVLNFILRTAS